MTLIYGIRHSFSVFFPPILEEFGWSRGNTVLMFSLNIFIYGLTAPFAGTIGSRWKPRAIMLAGVIILGLATTGCALASELWHFYIFFGILMPLGTAFCGWPLLAPAMSNWFATKRGLVMGLAAAGAGLSYTYSVFSQLLIASYGWRNAFILLGIVLLGAVLTLYVFFFRYRPEDKGLKAYGATQQAGTPESPADSEEGRGSPPRDWTLREVLKTCQLWLFVLAHMFYFGFATYMVLAHQVKYAEDAGYSSLLAASILGIFGIFKIIGTLSGTISDVIGREKTTAIAAALAIGSLLALLSVKDTSQPWLLYAYAVAFGYAAGLWVPTIHAGAADVFYGKNFGTVVGLILFGQGIGAAIGPWLGGYIYDIMGSYTVAFVICIIALVLAYASFWAAAPRNATKLRARNLGDMQT
jgi:sugar phosphate permease